MCEAQGPTPMQALLQGRYLRERCGISSFHEHPRESKDGQDFEKGPLFWHNGGALVSFCFLMFNMRS